MLVSSHSLYSKFLFRQRGKSARTLQQFVSRDLPVFFGLFFLVFIFESDLTVSFESFVFIPSASTVLSNKSWRTSENFTPLLSFANISTHARSIHQIPFWNLAKALIFLNLRVACVNLVQEVFECINFLTFEGESVVVSVKLRIEP